LLSRSHPDLGIWPENAIGFLLQADGYYPDSLNLEKEALGFYITAHPLDKYERELARISKVTTADLSSAPDGSPVQIAGVIHAVKLKNNKSGKRYATFSLEDRDGAVEAIAWSETYQKFEAIIMGITKKEFLKK